MEVQRTQLRSKEGVVLRDKMDKTRVVAVTRLYREPRFHKVMKKRVKYVAHDEKNQSHTGDKVRIIGSRALSRTKRWRIVELVEKAKV